MLKQRQAAEDAHVMFETRVNVLSWVRHIHGYETSLKIPISDDYK